MYKDLSLKDRAKVIREGVRLGLNSIDDILSLYDEAISIPEDPPVILKVNKSLADFVLRLKDPNRTYIRDWENPEYIATHKLSWAEDDKGAVIYPLVQNVNGKLIDFSRPPYDIWVGYENAIKTGDTIRMSPQEAEWFTTHYKDYYPSFDKYSKGGNIILDNNGYYAHPKYNKDGTTNDMLIEGNSTGTNITTQGIPFKIAAWDNLGNYQELEPNGEYYFPGSMVREHALQAGGLAKPFSYGDIPDVRYLKGGNIFLNGEIINRIKPIEEHITPIEPPVLDNTYVVRNYPYYLLPEVLNKNKRLSDEEISNYYASDILWTMENPKHKGLNSDGTYSAYEDEAGFNFGPGLHAKSNNLDINKTYTKQELDSIASNIALNYMKLISEDLETMQDGRYAGARDTLSAGPLLTMLDIAYNVKPKNKGNMPQKWPNLTDSLINGDIERAKENTYSGSTRRQNMRNQMIVYKPLEGITVHNEALGGNLFKKGGIYIKPENRGKFTALKKRTGHSASWFKAHGTPALKKMATFALNARHWKHDDGGHLFLEDGQIFKRPLDDLTGRNILTSPILPPKSYYEQFTVPELEPNKPQPLQPLEGTYGNKYSELVPMSGGTYVNNPINKGLQLDWRTRALEFAPFLAIGAGPAIGSTATWLATSKPALYNLGRMTLGSEIGGRSVDLASSLFTGNTWGLNVGNAVEGITGWNPNNTMVGLFVTDLTNPGYAGKEGLASLEGIKNRIKPYWNTNIAPKLEQAWMKITHPSYQKVYHGTPVDFDPTKFHSSTNEFGLHVAPQKQIALHFTSGYVNGLFVPNGVIKEFYVPKPRHRTIDMHNNGLNLLSKDEIWQHGIGGDFDDVSSLMGGSDFNIKDKGILDKLGLIEGKDYLLSKSGKYRSELINQSYFTNTPNFRYFLSRKDIHVNPREILGINDGELSLGLDDLISLRQAFNISPYTPMQKIPEDMRLSLLNINDRAGLLLYENGIPTIGYWNHSPIEGALWNYIVTDPRAIKLPRHNFRINAYGGDLFSKGNLMWDKK